MLCSPQHFSPFNLQAKHVNSFIVSDAAIAQTRLSQTNHIKKLKYIMARWRHLKSQNVEPVIYMDAGRAEANGVAVLTAYATAANRVLVLVPSTYEANKIREDFAGTHSSFLLKTGCITPEQGTHYTPSLDGSWSNPLVVRTFSEFTTIPQDVEVDLVIVVSEVINSHMGAIEPLVAADRTVLLVSVMEKIFKSAQDLAAENL